MNDKISKESLWMSMKILQANDMLSLPKFILNKAQASRLGLHEQDFHQLEKINAHGDRIYWIGYARGVRPEAA